MEFPLRALVCARSPFIAEWTGVRLSYVLNLAAVSAKAKHEFQYSPSDTSLRELSEWVVSENRCCPFFDFHIDLERQGTLLCLRLTGEKGIKPFMLAEFQVPQKIVAGCPNLNSWILNRSSAKLFLDALRMHHRCRRRERSQ